VGRLLKAPLPDLKEIGEILADHAATTSARAK
jgi:hypothetical protein